MYSHSGRLARDARRQRLQWDKRQRHTRPRCAWAPVAACTALLILAAGVVMVCVWAMSVERPSPPGFETADLLPTGETISLPLSTFTDGRARFYRARASTGHEVRFLVIKSADGIVRTAFDACDDCFRLRRGFRQVGEHLICNRCGRRFLPQQVNGPKGGCHPAPFEHTVDGDRVVIQAEAIEVGASFF